MNIIKIGYFSNSYKQKILYSSSGYLKIAHKIGNRWQVFEKQIDIPVNRRFFLNKFIEVLER